MKAVQSFESYLLNEVLGIKLTAELGTAKYKESFKINGDPVNFGISIASMGE